MIQLEFITESIINNKVIRFAKFGDGEYGSSIGNSGANCDSDVLFPELGVALNKAFVILAKTSNTYIGMWPLKRNIEFYENLYKPVPWVQYMILLRSNPENDVEDYKRAHEAHMYNFVKAIQDCPRKKIYVCNQKNARLCSVFRSEHVLIPKNCWFLKYNEIMKTILRMCTPDTIVLFSGGICSKVAIAELAEKMPTVSALDIGSSFDCLARGKETRSYQFNYQQEIAYYNDLLPNNWLDTIPL